MALYVSFLCYALLFCSSACCMCHPQLLIFVALLDFITCAYSEIKQLRLDSPSMTNNKLKMKILQTKTVLSIDGTESSSCRLANICPWHTRR